MEIRSGLPNTMFMNAHTRTPMNFKDLRDPGTFVETDMCAGSAREELKKYCESVTKTEDDYLLLRRCFMVSIYGPKNSSPERSSYWSSQPAKIYCVAERPRHLAHV